MTRMDRRKIRTRRQLMDALLKLMLTQDYETITVQDITDCADLGRATFYLHYKDKQELLVNTMQMMMDDLATHVEAERTAIAQITEDKLSAHISLYFAYIQQNSAVYKAILGENGMRYIAHQQLSYISTIVENILRTEQKEEKAEGIVPLHLIARFMAGAVFSLILWWLEHDMPHTPEYMGEVFDQLMNPGMCLNYGMPVEEFVETFRLETHEKLPNPQA